MFLERAAGFLIERGLTRGSSTRHNAEERRSAETWSELTFPRFYFYDVLRGLAALVGWAHSRRRSLPWSSLSAAVEGLVERFPDGNVAIQRRGFAGRMTRVRTPDGGWARREPASEFPLLTASSRVGEVSTWLSRQWRQTSGQLLDLADLGLIAGA